MSEADVRAKARRLAGAFIAKGDFTGWFEPLYASADADPRVIPWADMTVNPNLAEWLGRDNVQGDGRKALVVGCGLGDDAEELARLGFSVVAFDIAPTAIAWCRRRFPASPVDYCVADLFDPPPAWDAAFDLVLEAYTLQNFRPPLRQQAMRRIARFVAPGGTLVVIARGCDTAQDDKPIPWPIPRAEFETFREAGLTEVRFEDYMDQETPPVRRFRVEYRAE